ncbi:MAG: isopentenyl-diphosphate Delta-isomerase [Acidobacteria bacterium]|nr:isopentenyl-diphosphate Delta-isomerase [Acidobacteriota bacterium]
MQLNIKSISTIILLAALALSAFFMVNVEMPEWSYLVSSFSIILFAAPTVFASLRWIGKRETLIMFLLLGVFALGVETLAIKTGLPYGHFSYSDLLGFKLFGITPWTIFFAWTPLILAAFTIARKLTSNRSQRIILITSFLVIFDLILDPGAVYFRFWEFAEKGWYYGVPWTNFMGWVISGAVGAILVEVMAERFKPLLPVPVQLTESGFLTIFFWTSVALFAGMVFPAIIGIVCIIIIAAIYFRNHYAFDDMVVIVDEDRKPVATGPNLPIHTMETPLHLAFSVFLFNKKGELLLQRRALEKKTWGGVWSNSCCGHLMLHESVRKAAKRRLNYELGLKGIDLEVLLPDFRYKAQKDGVTENEFCPVLVGFTDASPVPNRSEVEEFKWVSWKTFLDECNSADSEYSPWAIEEANLLNENPGFNELFRANLSG